MYSARVLRISSPRRNRSMTGQRWYLMDVALNRLRYTKRQPVAVRWIRGPRKNYAVTSRGRRPRWSVKRECWRQRLPKSVSAKVATKC